MFANPNFKKGKGLGIINSTKYTVTAKAVRKAIISISARLSFIFCFIKLANKERSRKKSGSVLITIFSIVFCEKLFIFFLEVNHELC